jgi:hypothetical protein
MRGKLVGDEPVEPEVGAVETEGEASVSVPGVEKYGNVGCAAWGEADPVLPVDLPVLEPLPTAHRCGSLSGTVVDGAGLERVGSAEGAAEDPVGGVEGDPASAA